MNKLKINRQDTEIRRFENSSRFTSDILRLNVLIKEKYILQHNIMYRLKY